MIISTKKGTPKEELEKIVIAFHPVDFSTK